MDETTVYKNPDENTYINKLQEKMLQPPVGEREVAQNETIRKIEASFNEYKKYGNLAEGSSIKQKIVIDLNLLSKGKLNETNKRKVIEIANDLGLSTLAVCLEGGAKPLALPTELIDVIIKYAIEGASPQELVFAYLTVSKGFNKLLLTAPITLDFSSPKWSDKITDETLGKILHIFPNVKTLNLTQCRMITNEGLKHLASLENLRELFLREANINDEGLKHLAPLKNLTALDLSQTNIEDAGLAHLRTLTELITLNLWGATKISGDGLIHLEPLKKLSKLVLMDIPLTDAELAPLEDLKNLSNLYLHGTNTTQAGKDKLIKSLPNLLIR